MMKDIREARWAIAGYELIVVLATMHAVGAFAPSSGILDLLTGALTLLGLMLTVSVVQADSPTRSNAFWTTRPFAPWAVLVAKLVFAAVVIVGPPLLGQIAALHANGVVTEDLPRMVWLSAVGYAPTRSLR